MESVLAVIDRMTVHKANAAMRYILPKELQVSHCPAKWSAQLASPTDRPVTHGFRTHLPAGNRQRSAVEIAIEKDEKTAIQWLQEKTKNN